MNYLTNLLTEATDGKIPQEMIPILSSFIEDHIPMWLNAIMKLGTTGVAIVVAYFLFHIFVRYGKSLVANFIKKSFLMKTGIVDHKKLKIWMGVLLAELIMLFAVFGATLIAADMALFSKVHFTLGIWAIVWGLLIVLSIVLYKVISHILKRNKDIVLKYLMWALLFANGCTTFLFVVKFNIWRTPLSIIIAAGAAILYVVANMLVQKLSWIKEYYSFFGAKVVQILRTMLACVYILHLFYRAFHQTLDPNAPVEWGFVSLWTLLCFLECALSYRKNFAKYLEYEVKFTDRKPASYQKIELFGRGMFTLVNDKRNKKQVNVDYIKEISYVYPYRFEFVYRAARKCKLVDRIIQKYKSAFRKPKTCRLVDKSEPEIKYYKIKLIGDAWVAIYSECDEERIVKVRVIRQSQTVDCE